MVVTNVSEQPIGPIFKGQSVPERGGTVCRPFLQG